MAAFDDLKTTVMAYIEKVDVALADIAAKIQAAVDADDAGEAVDLKALQDDVTAAMDRVPPAPVPVPPPPAPEGG